MFIVFKYIEKDPLTIWAHSFAVIDLYVFPKVMRIYENGVAVGTHYGLIPDVVFAFPLGIKATVFFCNSNST